MLYQTELRSRRNLQVRIGCRDDRGFARTLLKVFRRRLACRIRSVSSKRARQILHAFGEIPAQIDPILSQDEPVRQVAAKYHRAEDFFLLRQQYNFPWLWRVP